MLRRDSTKKKKAKEPKAPKAKKTKAKKSPAGPSLPHKFSIYTVMLMTSLGALLIGCIMLYLEISAFGGFSAISGLR